MKHLPFYIILAFTLMLNACGDKNDNGKEKRAVRILAEMSDYTSLTFITDSHLWEVNDEICLYDTADDAAYNAKPVTADVKTSYFMFSMPIGSGTHTLVGICPSDAPADVSDGKISFHISQEQAGEITSLQAGKAEYSRAGHDDCKMALKPLYKVVNVCIGRSNRTVRSIKLMSKDRAMISGNITLDIETWTSQAMSSSVTVNLPVPLRCHNNSISIPVMVADIETTGYVAEVQTVEGEHFTVESVYDGFSPAEKSYELGISQALFGSLSQREANSLIDAGINYIEVTMNTFWRDQTEEEFQKRFESTKAIISNTPGLKVWSVHLPFSGTLDISLTDEDKRAANVELMSRMIRMAGDFKPEKLVLHPSSEPISESERKARLEYSKESIGKLLPSVHETGAQLCIENLPRTCLGRTSDEIQYLIEDYPDVMVCFDSNHLLIETHNSFFKNVGSRIGTIHASDYDKVDERHWVPGKGIIDWPGFLTGLIHYGYEGVFMTEVKSASVNEVKNSYTNVICK